MSDFRPELQRHVVSVLAPGERLLAAVRAMPVGPYGGSLGIFSGAVVGAVVHSVAVSRSVKKAALSRFPLAGRITIGLTDRRILMWTRGGFLGNTVDFLGEVPLTRVKSIDAEAAPGRYKLTFVLRDARAVTVEADKRDAPERFVEAFQGHVMIEATAATGSPARELAPPPPAIVATSHGAAATTVTARAATAVAEGGERKCPRCESRNPASADFCWRCFASFTGPPESSRRSPPSATVSKPPAPARSGTAGWTLPAKLRVGAFVAIPLMVAVFLAVLAFRGSDPPRHSGLSLPDSVAGARAIDSPEANRREEEILLAARGHGLTGSARLYGNGGVVSFGVAVYVNDAGLGDSPQTVMEPLVSGIAGPGAGSSVDLTTLTADSSGGVNYRCGQVVGSTAGATCVWQDAAGVGVVLFLNQGVSQARALTETVRRAVGSVAQLPDPSDPSVAPA